MSERTWSLSRPNILGDLLGTLFERRQSPEAETDDRSIADLCHALLAEKAEISGLQLAASILSRYATLDEDEKTAFFTFLNDDLDLDAAEIADLATSYGKDRDMAVFSRLSAAAEPRRQELLRRLNQAPGATHELVQMRVDLLARVKQNPTLKRTDFDFIHLLRSWFNRGFLVLRQINWDTSAAILEKVIAYEAVHEISDWDALRRRLYPEDRRCFAFFHPAMPDEPLIFVEVALTQGVPTSVQTVLADDHDTIGAQDADTAVFYSISNCQAGLAGISFGNSLIKQVVRDLSVDLPNLETYVTLSPIPGLTRWLAKEGQEPETGDGLREQAATYLLTAKRSNGAPFDPVARFHLGNGAKVLAVHADADISPNGMKQSSGAMVNYLYDLPNISKHHHAFASDQTVAASSTVKALVRQPEQDKG